MTLHDPGREKGARHLSPNITQSYLASRILHFKIDLTICGGRCGPAFARLNIGKFYCLNWGLVLAG